MRYTQKKDPASISSVQHASRSLGIPSNSWIIRLWRETDGAVIDDEFFIYAADEIDERNRTFDVPRNFPGKFAIGDDSGGRLIMLNQENEFFLVGMGESLLASSSRFESIESVLDFIRDEKKKEAVIGDIISVGERAPSLEEIAGVKKALSLNSSIAKLRSSLQTKDDVILHSVYAQKYKEALEKYQGVIRFSERS